MIRFLFVLLAVVSGVLAFIFQQTLLYLIASILLVIAAVILFQQVRTQFRVKAARAYPDSSFTEETSPAPRIRTGSQLKLDPMSDHQSEGDETQFAPPELRESGATDEELRAVGIIAVRPKTRSDDAEPPGEISEERTEAEPPAPAPPPREREEETRKPVEGPPPVVSDKVTAGGDGAVVEPEEAATVTDAVTSGETPAQPPRQLSFFRQSAIQSHLTALKDSLEAHTVALMLADRAASKYRTVRIVSDSRNLSAIRFFPFKGHFLSRLLPETTVLRVGSDEMKREDLSYYSRSEAIERLLVAPVMREDQVAGFLVTDFKKGGPAITRAHKDVLAAGGLLMGSLLTLKGGTLEPEPAHEAVAEAAPLDAARPTLRLVSSGGRSPQNEVIRYEMTRAREAACPLALALVFLDDKSRITAQGPTAVVQVEQWMRDRLEEMSPDGRVEHFGELGFGVFHYEDVDFVESWVALTQESFMTPEKVLDGTLIVGVAMLCDEHNSPEELQADAARALKAAYETGDGTILVG